jgi:hypothetical protein
VRTPSLYLVPVLVLVAAGAVSCSGSKSATGFSDDGGASGSSGGASSGSSGSSGDLLGGDGGSGSSGTAGNGCSDAAKLVYVVSDQNTLYSFQPASLTFTKIGDLGCKTGSQPNSMAVDRSGTAWVNYSDGNLYKVSTADASCQSTPFKPGQHGYTKFGMAFATDAAGGTAETLYVSGIVDGQNGAPATGQGVAKIDLTTYTLTVLGDFSGALQGAGAELTGNGAGRLFGFFTTAPAHLAQIDKSTGATSAVIALNGVSTGTDWAFSFWGGDFWFYTADTQFNQGDTTNVTRLKAATDNSLGVVKSQIGFRIVGAGVSTCAPTTPPK